MAAGSAATPQPPPDVGRDEADLAARAHVDPATYVHLYACYVDPVYRYCYRRLGRREAAEDATSQIFCQALEPLPRFRCTSFRSGSARPSERELRSSCDNDHVTATEQLAALARIDELLRDHGIEYWLFGGQAVDFHAGSVTRAHHDVDLAVWLDDSARIAALLEPEGWQHAPEAGEDGYTAYERGGVRLELALLARRRRQRLDPTTGRPRRLARPGPSAATSPNGHEPPRGHRGQVRGSRRPISRREGSRGRRASLPLGLPTAT